MRALQSCLCVSEVLVRILNFLGVRAPHLLAHSPYYDCRSGVQNHEKKIHRVNIGQNAYLIFQDRVNRFIAEVGNTVRLKRKAVASTIFLHEETQNPTGKGDFGRHIPSQHRLMAYMLRSTEGSQWGYDGSRSHWTGYERTVTSRRHSAQTTEVEPEIEYSGIEREVLDVAES
ncbi:hypothetical protein C8R45DRAFT_1033715, partial [Mycena sanguinolenta]